MEEETRRYIMLSNEDFEHTSEPSVLAREDVKKEFLAAVGSSVLRKLGWMLGIAIAAAWAYFTKGHASQ